jgi:F-type H+-transporting ATPase subunit epsilon
MSLHVEIVTPTATVFSGQADEVKAPGFLGEFGVLPDHTPFLSVVTPGVVEVISGGSAQRFVVGRGFVEAGPDRLTVLAEVVEAADSVDKSAAQAELEAAEALLASEDPNGADYAVAERRAEMARARLHL